MTTNFFQKLRARWTGLAIAESHRVDQLLRSPYGKALLVLIISGLVTTITTLTLQYVPASLELGSIATRDIKADRDYEIVDEEATATLQEEARRSVRPVYIYDAALASTIIDRIHEAFSQLRQKLQLSDNGARLTHGALFQDVDEAAVRQEFGEMLGASVHDDQWKTLVRERFSRRIEGILIYAVQDALKRPVLANRKGVDVEDKLHEVLIVRTRLEEGLRADEETKLEDLKNLPTIDQVKEEVLKKPITAEGFAHSGSALQALALASDLIVPNCLFDRQATETRQAEAVANVKNVIIKINAGEMIIRNGSRFEPWHIKVLRGIQKEKGRGTSPFRFIGAFLLVLAFLIIPFYIGKRFLRRFHPTRSDYLLMGGIGLFTLVIVRISLALAPAIQQALFFPIPDRALIYAVPLAAGVMLVQMLVSVESALIFALPLSAFAGLFPETGLRFTTFSLVMTLTAVLASTRIDKRGAMIRAGAIIGSVGAVAMLGMKLIDLGSITEAQSPWGMLWFICFAFLGGISSAFLAMIVLPFVEAISGKVTDIKLLELANLNHPLLRELIVRAPGTYHHSHLVGILAEAAAEATGANPLLVRVGAYYHDIGKMKKPVYFIENSKGLQNRHDSLSPHMSARIVASHVKEGMELAKGAGLPKAIIDMIPEHHGTRLIAYFYEKAKAAEEASASKVDPNDFRYPGPKPQTREAAIMMLSDVTEAAVRSLKEKTSIRIEQTVKRAINDIFAESQLDECDLTLKDLNEIARAFIRILLGIYHQRIEYPKESSGARPEISVVEEVSAREDPFFESPSQEGRSDSNRETSPAETSTPRQQRS